MIDLRVITGPMFSEKTEEVIKLLRKATHKNKKILLLTPQVDTREERNIVTRVKADRELGKYSKLFIQSVVTANEMRGWITLHRPNILAIDEIHLFDKWLCTVIRELMQTKGSKDFQIIAAGLDMDYMTKPFEITMELMAMANHVQKETTTCFKCKNELANLTYKKPGGSSDRIQVGGRELYEARCRRCYSKAT